MEWLYIARNHNMMAAKYMVKMLIKSHTHIAIFKVFDLSHAKSSWTWLSIWVVINVFDITLISTSNIYKIPLEHW